MIIKIVEYLFILGIIISTLVGMKFNSTDDISMLACFTIMAGLLTLTCVLIRDIGNSYTFSGSRTRNINHHNDDDDEPDVSESLFSTKQTINCFF